MGTNIENRRGTAWMIALGAVAMAAFVAGCGESESTLGEGEGQMNEAKPAAASSISAGEYKSSLGMLTVKSATASELVFALNVSSPEGNVGELGDSKAKLVNGTWVHSNNEFGACTLRLKPSANIITVEQDGLCGLGMNVTASGTYTRVIPPSVGVYRSSLGTLTIKSATESELVFSLIVSSPQGNTGELGDSRAERITGAWMHSNNEFGQCLLRLTPSLDANAITVEQAGGCGFGLNVNAAANYTRKAP